MPYEWQMFLVKILQSGIYKVCFFFLKFHFQKGTQRQFLNEVGPFNSGSDNFRKFWNSTEQLIMASFSTQKFRAFLNWQ